MLSEIIIAELEALEFHYTEIAIVKKMGNQWCVVSESTGKKMGCYSDRPAAERRLKQVEMFKHMKGGEEMARSFCYCSACGAEFMSPKRCDLGKCPVCGETDDLYELTGVI